MRRYSDSPHWTLTPSGQRIDDVVKQHLNDIRSHEPSDVKALMKQVDCLKRIVATMASFMPDDQKDLLAQSLGYRLVEVRTPYIQFPPSNTNSTKKE